jgi:hypothetical protein
MRVFTFNRGKAGNALYVFIVAAYGKSWFWDYIENKGTKNEVNLIEANLIGLMYQLICLSESGTRFNESQC